MSETKEKTIIGIDLAGTPKNLHLNRKIQLIGNTKKICIAVPLESDWRNIQL